MFSRYENEDNYREYLRRATWDLKPGEETVIDCRGAEVVRYGVSKSRDIEWRAALGRYAVLRCSQLIGKWCNQGIQGDRHCPVDEILKVIYEEDFPRDQMGG